MKPLHFNRNGPESKERLEIFVALSKARGENVEKRNEFECENGHGSKVGSPFQTVLIRLGFAANSRKV